MADFAKIRV